MSASERRKAGGWALPYEGPGGHLCAWDALRRHHRRRGHLCAWDALRRHHRRRGKKDTAVLSLRALPPSPPAAPPSSSGASSSSAPSRSPRLPHAAISRPSSTTSSGAGRFTELPRQQIDAAGPVHPVSPAPSSSPASGSPPPTSPSRLMGEGSIAGVGLRRRGRTRPGGWRQLDPLLHRELRARWGSGAMHGMLRSASSSLSKRSMCSAWCGRRRCGGRTVASAAGQKQLHLVLYRT
ncbi:hypothetical protein VPH35_004478 [Triticum aestivum]